MVSTCWTRTLGGLVELTNIDGQGTNGHEIRENVKTTPMKSLGMVVFIKERTSNVRLHYSVHDLYYLFTVI